MKGEYFIMRSQLKGYIFELLKKNNFVELDLNVEPNERVKKTREGFIELKGRGSWHQIDCPCDYSRLIPFSYPTRILGEVKFHKSPTEKNIYVNILA